MAQRKRILIISYYFAPQNIIGAVRPTKLAKYLTRMGHEVTVICGLGRDGKVDPTLARDLQELQDVRLIREWNPLHALQERKRASQGKTASTAAAIKASGAGNRKTLKKWLLRAVDALYVSQFWLADVSFRRRAIRECQKTASAYDVVFSTYSPLSVHQVASELKRRGIAKRWIADFRDEVVLWFKWMEPRKEKYLQMVRREADVISAVSQGFLEMMALEGCGRVLSNGYDREDIPAAAPRETCQRRMRVVYCGQMQDSRRGVGGRDITPMFRALRRAVDEGLLSMEELELSYAGREGGLFRHYAASCQLESCVEDIGQVSRERSISLQQSADILLMASVHTFEQRGILTGKLFEYMMMDRPIVCCMSGDLANSGVKQVLEETGMGLCCEQASGKADEEKLYQYVCTLIQRWRNGGELLLEKKQEAVDAYNYQSLAQELERWIDEA